MARPTEHDKRRQLAQAAVEVLERQGVDLSMAALADALEVKRPTLLYHFPTKAHIVEDALVALLIEQAAHVVPRVAKHTHPIDRLYAHLRAVYGFHAGNEARFVFLTQAIAATAGPRLPEIVAAGAQVFEAHRQDTVRRLRMGIRQGMVASCDAKALFATVRGLTDGLMVQRVMTGAPLTSTLRFVWTHLLEPLRLEPKSAKNR
ncbi:MAG: TetR/AcrR family transcriptional regulator [Myxococcales bacterium]|nr:TetR/AcrR family transcriptional regulator [Myxococcales bacterium]